MNLREELKEVREALPKLGPVAKVLLCVSFLSNAISLASIADDAYALRGFLRSGVDMFRSVRDPALAFVVSRTGFNISGPQADSLVFVGFLLAANVASYRTLTRQFAIPAITSLVIFGMVTRLVMAPGFERALLVFTCAFPFGIALTGLMGTQRARKASWMTLSYALAVVLAVCALAGISEGLTRE